MLQTVCFPKEYTIKLKTIIFILPELKLLQNKIKQLLWLITT